MNSLACRTLLLSALLCLPLLSSCSSLHLELYRIGLVAVPSNASSITGTFSNASHGRQITLHLWDMVHEPPTKSLETDRVVISRAGFGRIQMRLLRNGKVLDQRTLPFSPRGNHLHLGTQRTFKLLPFGFGGSRESLGLSSTREGELVVVSHTSSYGLILFYSAGDGSTTAHRFARLPDLTRS
ncbi:MAG: hypothetical protein ACO1TE_24250 [Prosthecobacter sp.]